MRELIVSEAPLPRVAGHVKAVAEDQGGVVSSHTHRATEFDHLKAKDDNWSRSGYIGTYQPFKQDQIRIRIRVWASWPRRWFRFFVFLGFAEAILFFLMSLAQIPPSPNVWIVTAILTFLAIGISLLTYSTSWATSSEVEDALARHIGSEIRADETLDTAVYTLGAWEEHRQDLIDEAVEEAKAKQTQEQEAEGTVSSGGLLAKVKRRTGLGDDDDEEDGSAEDADEADEAPGEEDQADEEPAQAGTDEDDEGSPGFFGRLKRKVTGGDEDGAEEEPAQTEEDEEVDEADDQADDADPSEEDEESSGGFLSKLPFVGGKEGTDETEDAADEPDDDPGDAEDEPSADDDDDDKKSD